jgi:hypothetical protein
LAFGSAKQRGNGLLFLAAEFGALADHLLSPAIIAPCSCSSFKKLLADAAFVAGWRCQSFSSSPVVSRCPPKFTNNAVKTPLPLVHFQNHWTYT